MKYLSFLVLFLGFPLLAFATTTGTEFVPLTNIPFLTETGNAFNLEHFLNQLYRICIGIAAVVAVLQIMRAGIMYMGGDSVTEKKEAKNLIALSIGGLILVLSPVVVFSIINPEILSLKLDVSGLETASNQQEEFQGATLWVDSTSSPSVAIANCILDGGVPVPTCVPKSGGSTMVPIQHASECLDPTAITVICRAHSETGPVTGACTDYSTIAASPAGFCDGSLDQIQIERTCCAGLSNSAVCCGIAESAPPPPNTNEMFAWKGEYYESASCAINPETAASCTTTMLQGGAYATQAQCQREFESATEGKTIKGELLCSCDFTLGSSGGAYCLSDI